ncbi:MAG TPA: NAD(P)/FAD-dependent oxidoreductase [Methanothrix sp.]|nr:NAD(P)/FAD-dependent oxidoreductase [Methanothrix sp.]HPC88704.1 NAD(P)/FAD-dependent oxidoreductase [Methanothrix sp.]HQE87964.1 NAD(P)/FAD-dependent oxidoreductase [Methanothrix sp.]HRS84311.1 NAD(P)/FAD-dependent oxidoreductase [Methanothrix sp.]HRT17743.1 NAD(P)/FAD-dependent oxidoreductase [Methanothrix sp.]
MKDEIAVAVVGAGPAGSSAAEAAAAEGVRVLLIDRKREIGSPVQCGGFLPEAEELAALLPAASLPQTLIDIPERIILHRTRWQRIYSPSGASKQFSVAGRVLDRRAYDRYLAARAARAGADILPGSRARLKDGALLLSGRRGGEIRPQIIIGADGPLSSISRAMGNRVPEMGLCLEYEMADVQIDADAAEMYFSARFAPGGYAWIIPLGGDVANVGIGVRASYLSGERLAGILERFIAEHPVAKEKLDGGEVLAVMRGPVPAGGTVGEVFKGNMILAGDAAGHVMATSGGGIPLAVVAGGIAGRTAADAALGRAPLSIYPSRIGGEFGVQLFRSVQIRRMVDVAMKSDRLIDALFAALSPQQMKAVMRAQMPELLRSRSRS